MTTPLSLSGHETELLLEMSELAATAADDPPGAVAAWLTDLVALIPGDVAVISVVDGPGRVVVRGAQKPLEDDGPPDEVFWMHYPQFRPCNYADTSPGLGAVSTIDDFLSRRELRSTGMYVDYLRPGGTTTELLAWVPGDQGRTLRLIVARASDRDFGDRERMCASLLRVHLPLLLAERTPSGLAALTPRQNELLCYVAEGCTNSQIARYMFLSEGTVRKHLENIYDRLGVRGRVAAVAVLMSEPPV
jgi:DNA-binding CsgD family transcriptional regulator